MHEARARDGDLAVATGTLPAAAGAALPSAGGRGWLSRPALLACATVLAAAVIGATALGLADGRGAAGTPAPAAYGPARPPLRFSPLAPYLQFGWLPRGDSLYGGQVAAATVQLAAGPASALAAHEFAAGPSTAWALALNGQSTAWAVQAFAAGRCNLASQQVLAQLRRHLQPRLSCITSYTTRVTSGWTEPIERQAAPVDGHLAFWTASGLAWQYARGSWAELSRPDAPVPASQILKVARGIRYDAATRPPIKFPFQLTGLPASWQIESTFFVPGAGVLRASQFLLANGDPDAPSITIGPAAAPSSCQYWHGQSERTTLNGHPATVSNLRQIPGSPATQQACAPDAHGWSVIIATYDTHTPPSGIQIYAQHTRLLGTNPANWTTTPLTPSVG